MTTASTTRRGTTVSAAKLTISATSGKILPILKPVCVSAWLTPRNALPEPPPCSPGSSAMPLLSRFQPASATPMAQCRAPSVTRSRGAASARRTCRASAATSASRASPSWPTPTPWAAAVSTPEAAPASHPPPPSASSAALKGPCFPASASLGFPRQSPICKSLQSSLLGLQPVSGTHLATSRGKAELKACRGLCPLPEHLPGCGKLRGCCR